MVIILALCIPITAIVVGYFTLKAVQLGLRWQIETKQQQLPTMDKPIVNPFEKKTDIPDINDPDVFYEYMHGPRKKEGE